VNCCHLPSGAESAVLPIPLPSFLSREPKPLLANMIEFEKLKDSNWGQWKMFMKALLVRKGLWDVVDGTEVLPAGSSSHKSVHAFRKKQAKAIAEITLHVDVAQLSFIQNDDPKTVWDALAAVHQARGMATRLTLRRQFLRLQKPEGPMQNFIAEARRLAQLLQEIGVTVDDEDIILVLTGGLPLSYDNFVITLDSMPPSELTLDYVITRLLNEEARQLGNHVDTSRNRDAAFTATPHRTRDLSKIICFNCGQKGHFQSNCPEPKRNTANVAAASNDDDVAW
jgi:hypothetical protein